MTLWTPQGEHKIPKEPEPPEHTADETTADETTADETMSQVEAMSPEEREQAEALAKELQAARERLAAAPAEVVVVNHLMGFYELAAIHLTAKEPRLEQARLAIDALGAVLDGLEGRLGENEAALRDARADLQIMFVQIAG